MFPKQKSSLFSKIKKLILYFHVYTPFKHLVQSNYIVEDSQSICTPALWVSSPACTLFNVLHIIFINFTMLIRQFCRKDFDSLSTFFVNVLSCRSRRQRRRNFYFSIIHNTYTIQFISFKFYIMYVTNQLLIYKRL